MSRDQALSQNVAFRYKKATFLRPFAEQKATMNPSETKPRTHSSAAVRPAQCGG